jgi:neurofibromin 1
MTPLNKFLESNITNVTRYLSELHVSMQPIRIDVPWCHIVQKYGGVPDDINDNWTGTTSDETDVIVLHRFFQKHADRIGKELLSHSSGIDVNSSTVTGKQIWDNFCALLVDLGPPLEVPQLSNLDSSSHRGYLEFMSKYANRSTTPVEHIFMETDTKVFWLNDSGLKYFLTLKGGGYCCIRFTIVRNRCGGLGHWTAHVPHIQGLRYSFSFKIDNSSLVLQILTSETYRSCLFDIILDCTSFNANSEIPLQWLKYCAELIPSDIRNRFMAARILNPNTLMQKFMRRLYNISAGTWDRLPHWTPLLHLHLW